MRNTLSPHWPGTLRKTRYGAASEPRADRPPPPCPVVRARRPKVSPGRGIAAPGRNFTMRGRSTMALDPKRDEEERQQYELEYGRDREKELERYKKAVEMCIAGGFLRREKF